MSETDMRDIQENGIKVGDVLASYEVRIGTWTCPKCGRKRGSHSRAWSLSDMSNGRRMCDECFDKYRKEHVKGAK